MADQEYQITEEDTFKVLLATDNHLGFLEKDPIRGMDSFAAFEEVLRIATMNKVDLVLLGGDLFHENSPSRNTLFRTMKLLRTYCMSNSEISFSVLGDASQHFGDCGVNFASPFYNVGLPIFSIHGNHDDPTMEFGQTKLAALDLLSVNALVNYFGKTELPQVEVRPLLLQKGSTRVAIYGLGNIRDERLHRAWRDDKVAFIPPPGGFDVFFLLPLRLSWFNILVIHQNRNRGRGEKNYIPERFIPNEIDLVMWGHEHECLVDAVQGAENKPFFVTQPGSSVPTSLIEGERRKKHLGMLHINRQHFKLDSIQLHCVRPFVIREISLQDLGLKPMIDGTDEIFQKLFEEVSEMVEVAKQSWDKAAEARQLQQVPYSPPDIMRRPLIRLKVEHSGFPVLNNQRFGARFADRVANPADMLDFKRKRQVAMRQTGRTGGNSSGLSEPILPAELTEMRVEDLIEEQLKQEKLGILLEKELNTALAEFVDNRDANAIKTVVDDRMKKTQNHIRRQKLRHDAEKDLSAVIETEALGFRGESAPSLPPDHEQTATANTQPAQAESATPRRAKRNRAIDEDVISSSTSEDEMIPSRRRSQTAELHPTRTRAKKRTRSHSTARRR